MKIENAVDLKTFPEIKVKLKFPFSFPFQFFSVVGEVRKQVALKYIKVHTNDVGNWTKYGGFRVI